MAPVFNLKNGDLSAYALLCGYIQTRSKQDSKADYLTDQVQLYKDGVYHVKAYKDGSREFWEGFETLTEARKIYNKLAKQFNFNVKG